MAGWRLQTIMIIVIVTAIFIFLLPIDRISSCQCPQQNNVPSDNELNVHRALGRKDLIVYGDQDLNKTLKQIENFRIGKYDHSALRNVDKFRDTGWVLDCITWERKWENPSQDLEPHEFLFDVYQLGAGEDHEHRKNTFQQIFVKRDWPGNDPSFKGLQSSGPGAMLTNTFGVISALNVIITKLKQYLGKSKITLLDLPCGDLQWMSKYLFTRDDILYTGADIVPEIIDHHKREFSNLARSQFIEWDIVKTPLNQSYDLILCRGLLQHLWKVDAVKALDNISSSRSGFLLITTYPDSTQNKEVEKDALGSRKSQYNLELPPFLLEPPICTNYDWNVEHLGLWPLPLRQKFEY